MVRTNWHLGDPPAHVDEDPLARGSMSPRVQDVGVPIHLRDEDGLARSLARSLREEADLFAAGVTCPVRDRHDTCCSACPLSHHADAAHRLAPLCRVGREQEVLLTMLAHRHEERG